jgi:hypothetical protein
LEDVAAQYLYAPAFAILFIPFTFMPIQATLIINTILHMLAYGLMIILWGKIFREFNLEKASRIFVWTLPIWLIFSPFWDDLNYLNIYTIMALVATLFIEAIIKEDILSSSIWLTLILITKPQWAVMMAVPLLLGRYKFFLKLILGAIVGYVLVALLTVLVGGPGYAISQYREQFQFLARLSGDYPWRGPDSGFLGYNHSIKQIIVFIAGVNPRTLRLADIVKGLFLLPLAVLAVKHFFHPVRKPGYQVPELALEFAFILYLGAFLWLDLVWEIFLSVAVVVYLFAVEDGRWVKLLILAIFIPYAILDIWRVIVYAAGSPMYNDAYFVWDYSTYIPIIMMVILALYGVVIKRLWQHRFIPQTLNASQVH